MWLAGSVSNNSIMSYLLVCTEYVSFLKSWKFTLWRGGGGYVASWNKCKSFKVRHKLSHSALDFGLGDHLFEIICSAMHFLCMITYNTMSLSQISRALFGLISPFGILPDSTKHKPHDFHSGMALQVVKFNPCTADVESRLIGNP